MEMKENEELYEISKIKLKLFLGLLSVIVMVLYPYLSIVKISFNMELFQSAFISLIFLSFWIVSAKFLRYSEGNIIINKKKKKSVCVN